LHWFRAFIVHLSSIFHCCKSFKKDNTSANPDKLKNGIQNFEGENEKEVLYMFLAKYVRKTHSDSEIKRELKSNEGMSFLDLITPSDIAFWIFNTLLLIISLTIN
jgi:hypothetical protein